MIGFLRALVLSAALPVASVASAQESLIESLRTAARSHPGDWQAALSLGRALRRAGHPSQAEGELRRGIALAGTNPASVQALDSELARVYVDAGDVPRALATCNHLMGLAGAEAEGRACVAEADLVWQRATEAELEAKGALARDPHCYDALVAEGRAFEFELDSTRAVAALRGATALRSEDARAHVALGRVLWRSGEKNEGVGELRKAVELDPLGAEALFELASALPVGSERTSLLERATRERPSFGKAWLELGVERLAAGHLAEAQRAAESAARADPANADVGVLLGRIALADGRVDDAIRGGQAVLKSLPNNAAAALLVADGNAEKGEIDLAVESYQIAWGLDHRDPTALVNASRACHAAGRDTSARAFGVRATEAFPEWGPAWMALGDALAAQKEPKAAREAYGRALLAPAGAVDRGAVQAKLAVYR
jgi:tetratricopeptide (TPR) repeat protein